MSESASTATPRTSLNRLVEARHGTFVYNANDVYIGRSLEFYGEWAEGEVDVFRQIVRPGDVVVDVGANIGTHTVFLARAVGNKGKVYALEPQRVVFQLLCANVALNGLLNVYCMNVAATEAEQGVTVPEIDYEVPNNFGHLQLGSWQSGERVPGVPLDLMRLQSCRLLKVDVEGGELEVLRGATSLLEKCRPVVFVENNAKERSAELISLLTEAGFDLFWHLSFFFNQQNFRKHAENVFGPLFDVNVLAVPKELQGLVRNFEPVTGPADTWEAAVERSRARGR